MAAKGTKKAKDNPPRLKPHPPVVDIPIPVKTLDDYHVYDIVSLKSDYQNYLIKKRIISFRIGNETYECINLNTGETVQKPKSEEVYEKVSPAHIQGLPMLILLIKNQEIIEQKFDELKSDLEYKTDKIRDMKSDISELQDDKRTLQNEISSLEDRLREANSYRG